MSVISFIVYGTPAPQGSMRAFKHAKTGAVITTSDNAKTKPWKQEVSLAALKPCHGFRIDDGPVALTLYFYLRKPKSAKRNSPTVKPDIDKLTRAILDALTGIAYRDDSQVVFVKALKRYDVLPRCEIHVEEGMFTNIN